MDSTKYLKKEERATLWHIVKDEVNKLEEETALEYGVFSVEQNLCRIDYLEKIMRKL